MSNHNGSNGNGNNPVELQLLRLGDSEYGINRCSIEMSINEKTGEARFFLAAHGGRLRQVEPKFKALSVALKPLGSMPVIDIIEIFKGADMQQPDPPLLTLVGGIHDVKTH